MNEWLYLNLTWDDFWKWLPILIGGLDLLIVIIFVPWTLMTKPNATSAVAWCLLLVLLPFIGAILYLLFGYQHVNRPLRRKRRHKIAYSRSGLNPRGGDSVNRPKQMIAAEEMPPKGTLGGHLAQLALRFDAFQVTKGNRVTFYHDGQPAYDAMLEAIRAAKHHVHLEKFIIEPDSSGELFLDALAEKAEQGVQVRVLYDAMGSLRLGSRILRKLKKAGGQCYAFLPVNLLRRRIQVNLRNHRKILVVDGSIGFSGGLNIGNEYVGKNPKFGYWRDTHFRIEGPAVSHLQRIFAEDWDFAIGERLIDTPDAKPGQSYYQPMFSGGDQLVQVIDSGPDQELKSIREIYFSAILAAKQRVWIASPYFVPDDGILDALRLAGYRGVDVRLLSLFHPDKWIPLYAARYYWPVVMAAGVKVYQYNKGMMHAKVLLVDGQWASVGSANFDNRSFYLNFETNCLFYSPAAVAELEAQYLRDLQNAIEIDKGVYANRPFAGRFLENACRLLSPVL